MNSNLHCRSQAMYIIVGSFSVWKFRRSLLWSCLLHLLHIRSLSFAEQDSYFDRNLRKWVLFHIKMFSNRPHLWNVSWYFCLQRSFGSAPHTMPYQTNNQTRRLQRREKWPTRQKNDQTRHIQRRKKFAQFTSFTELHMEWDQSFPSLLSTFRYYGFKMIGSKTEGATLLFPLDREGNFFKRIG